MKRNQLIIFFALTFAMAWPLQAAFVTRGGGLTQQAMLLVVLSLVSWTPAVAALIVLILTRDREERRAIWHLGPPTVWSSLGAGLIATQVGTLTALSVILAWIFVNTGGSLVLATLLRAAFDTSAFAFPAAASSGTTRIILTLVLCLVAVGLTARDGVKLSRTAPAKRL